MATRLDRRSDPDEVTFGGARAPCRDIHFVFWLDNLPHIAVAFGVDVAESAAVEAVRRISAAVGTGGLLRRVGADRLELTVWDYDLFGGETPKPAICGRFAQMVCERVAAQAVRCGADRVHLVVSGAFSRPHPASTGRDGALASPKAAWISLARWHDAPAPPSDDPRWITDYRMDMARACEVLGAVKRRRLRLVWRPLQADAGPAGREAVPHLLGDGGQSLPVAGFAPSLDRLGLRWLFDDRLLSLVLNELWAAPQARIALDFEASVAATEFWWTRLATRLADPRVASRLILQVREPGREVPATTVVRRADWLRRCGCEVRRIKAPALPARLSADPHFSEGA
jgi:hypothetical protein